MLADTDIPLIAPGATVRLGDIDPVYLLIQEAVGTGATGIVYRASSAKFPADVVVKIPRSLTAGTSLLCEARWTPRPSPAHFAYEFFGIHPAYLPGLEVGLPVPATLARYYPGGTIAHWLELHGTASIGHALRWIVEIATTLRHAGLIHRDIKPNNIFLDERGHAWLGDYGLAVPLDPLERQRLGIRLRPDQIVGTLEYMSPEGMRFPHEIDQRSDIYALGLVLYELAAGQTARIHRGDLDLNVYIREQQAMSYLLDYTQITNKRMRTICERCTNSSRSKRYQSYDALIADAVTYADPG